MNGRIMGILNVYIKDFINYISKVYIVLGNRGDVWVKIVVNLNSLYLFQILLEGVVGSGYYSDIVIDDIVFSKGCKKLNQIFVIFVIIFLIVFIVNFCGSG